MVNGSANRWAQAYQAEEQIRQWLEGEGADYLTHVDLSPYKRARYRRIDFVVLKPVPFAIDVRILGDQKQRAVLMKRMAERWLAKRIALAERYGRFLPLVVVSHLGADSDTSLPFVDAVFDVDNLPSIHDVPNLISLEPTTQEILRKGPPTKVEFTDHEEALALWSKSLTMEDLLRAEAFPADTIAERTRQLARAQLAETVSQDQILPGMSVAPQSEPDEERQRHRRERARAFSAVRRSLDTELEATIAGNLGGEFVHSRVPLPGIDHTPTALPAREWQAPNGRRIVIRTYSVGGIGAIVKAQELFAEARMLRAFTRIPESSLLLLLSIELFERTFKVHGTGAPLSIDPYLITHLTQKPQEGQLALME